MAGNLGGFQVISPCQNVYYGGQKWVCSPDVADCVNGNFTLAASNVTATKITGNVASSLNTSTVSTITATTSACPTSPTQNTGVSSTTLGVAVAVPVVVLSILALLGLFFFFREHKKRVNAERAAQDRANATTISHPQDSKIPIAEIGGNRTYELPTTDGQGS
jgi:uncharacterized transporter YbjL